MVAGRFVKLSFYETPLYVDVGYFRVAVKWGRNGPKSWRIDCYYLFIYFAVSHTSKISCFYECGPLLIWVTVVCTNGSLF